ncbi:MAG: hypothetical protein R3B70_07640 [Polyangiaceae bacterium]
MSEPRRDPPHPLESTLELTPEDARDRGADADAKEAGLPFVPASADSNPYAAPSGGPPKVRVASGTLDTESVRRLAAAAWDSPPPVGTAPPAEAPPKVVSQAAEGPPKVVSQAAERRGWKVAPRAAATASAPQTKALGDMSVLAVSNAAADPVPGAPRGAAAPAPVRPASPAIELLFCDADLAPRLRKRSEYSSLLAASALAPDGSPEEQKESQARRDVGLALAKGQPSPASAVEAAFSEAFEQPVFIPPLLLVQARLSLPFDEHAHLEAIVASASPFAEGQRRLEAVLDEARELLKAPRVRGPETFAADLVFRIQEAFSRGQRRLPPRYLEEQTERLLLEQRAYQTRTLFGDSVIRALCTFASGAVLVVYLPEHLRAELPLFPDFEARLFVEARPRADRYEARPLALRALSAGRLVQPG